MEKTDDGACLDHRTVQVRCTMHLDWSHTERQDCIWNHYSVAGDADIASEKEGSGEQLSEEDSFLNSTSREISS